MRSIELTIVFTLIFSANVINCYSQDSEPCRAKLLYLSKSYEGDCKKGLAHGEGIAMGEDYYKGEFKKGLPHGKGRYVWFDGSIYDGDWIHGQKDGYGIFTQKIMNRDTVTEGYWKKDRYVGKENLPSYKVSVRRDINRYTFTKVRDDGADIRVNFMRSVGTKNVDIRNFVVDYNSGSESRGNGYIILEGIKFPFVCNLSYATMDNMNSTLLNIVFNFTINEPGSWLLMLSNN